MIYVWYGILALFLASCITGYKAYITDLENSIKYSIMTSYGLLFSVVAAVVAGILQWTISNQSLTVFFCGL